jgi:DNA-binding transcriptional ArsR family regulator
MAALPENELNAVFAALADPTRRAIVARLAQGDCAVQELAQPFELSAPAITKHLKVLERAGLITRSRVAQSRPCHLQPQALDHAMDWVQQYRRMWEGRLDRLDAYLMNLQAQSPQAAPEKIANSTSESPESKPR